MPPGCRRISRERSLASTADARDHGTRAISAGRSKAALADRDRWPGVAALWTWTLRHCLRAWARPTVVGAEPAAAGELVYALANSSSADVQLLDIVAAEHGLPAPTAPLDGFGEPGRHFFLNKPAGPWRRNTMRELPPRLRRLEAKLSAEPEARLWLVPVSIFWGRAANKERSWIRTLLSEGWSMSSRLRRTLIFLFNRQDIIVQIGEPLAWHEIVAAAAVRGERRAEEPPSAAHPEMLARRTARLLRVKFRNQKVAALGPDLSHRRTLVAQILRSPQVTAAVDVEAAPGRREAVKRRARRDAWAIAADMSYPTVRFFDILLTWFWNRVYDGVVVQGVEDVAAAAEFHTLVYVPCHRSHIDYLLLSYVLYHRGLMLPHIAAGDNLDMPFVGGLLRGGGAFFMRRRFRNDRVYGAVFAEYVYQVFRRGHSMEYFVEGGRSRTGRLLPARTGMIQMTLDAHARGVPRPLAFVPVYFGYEKLVEASSYVEELRGADKRRETLADLLRSVALLRQSLGMAHVSFGKAIALGDLLRAEPVPTAREVGERILMAVNASAAVNAVNLISLATLSMPRQAIDEASLVAQIDLYRDLLRRDADHHAYTVTTAPADELVQRAEKLKLLRREAAAPALGRAGGGAIGGDILRHDDFTAVLMTWYRNNVLHVLAAPAFMACLIVNRRRGIRRSTVRRLVATVFPFVAQELKLPVGADVDRWLDHLLAAGIVEQRGDGLVAAKAPEQRLKLRLLANTVMQTLERFYIAAALLADAGAGVLDRKALLAACRATAARISSLYGIDAPEFADGRLFEGFLQGLAEHGVLTENEDGSLVVQDGVRELLRAARGVISLELRQALG